MNSSPGGQPLPTNTQTKGCTSAVTHIATGVLQCIDMFSVNKYFPQHVDLPKADFTPSPAAKIRLLTLKI